MPHIGIVIWRVEIEKCIASQANYKKMGDATPYKGLRLCRGVASPYSVVFQLLPEKHS